MNSIKLNFINHSNDTNNSSVVIFQKNEATSFEELAVAFGQLFKIVVVVKTTLLAFQ